MSTAKKEDVQTTRLDQSVLDQLGGRDEVFVGADSVEDEDLGDFEAINEGIESVFGIEVADDDPDKNTSEVPQDGETAADGEAEEEGSTDPEAADETDAAESAADEADGTAAEEAEKPEESEEPGAGKAEEPEEPEAGKAEEPEEPWVPKARLDQMSKNYRQKIEALESQLKEMQQGMPDENGVPQIDVPEIENFDTRAKEIFDKALDGDLESATRGFRELMLETNRTAMAEVIKRVPELVEAKTSQAEKVRGYDDILTDVQTEYPFLDNSEGNESFDADATAEVIALRDAYMSNGMAAGAALRQAVDKLAKANDWTSAVQTRPATPPKPPAGETVRQERREQSVRRAAKTEASTPKDAGPAQPESEGLPNVRKLSDEEYWALPEATRARLRGDVL